jgi:endo-1,4-beta-xylanase
MGRNELRGDPAKARRSRGLRTLAIAAVITVIASACTLRHEATKAGVLIGAGATNPSYLDDPQFAKILGEQFNSLSPENELKWSFTEPQRGVFDFTGLDRLVDYAKRHSMVVKGHGLISGCCNPEWLLQITEPAALRAAVTSHFRTLMTRYGGTMDRWDVVTEPLSIAGGTGLAPNHFSEVLGDDYIAEVFRIAHAADPGAELFINESLVEYQPGKRQELYDLVAGLVADDVPITGVGLEFHTFPRGPEPGVLTEIVQSYRALGLEVAITELDVNLSATAPDPLALQAETYSRVVSECLRAGCRDISLWGFADSYAYPLGSRKLLFDENYRAKPAFFAVFDALHEFAGE